VTELAWPRCAPAFVKVFQLASLQGRRAAIIPSGDKDGFTRGDGHAASGATTVGAYAVDPKAAYQVMRAWRAYSRDLEQSCSGTSSLPHKVAVSIIALMFALGFVAWFATFSASIWR
jgi:hypothetical protein